jgi:hypothetical protein
MQPLRTRPFGPQGLSLLLSLALIALCGCVRREGRNSDCQWPRSPESKTSGANRLNLKADLEFAEELADRYMAAHYGPRDPEAAARAKNRCFGMLLGEIGKEHGITAQEAFYSFGQRSAAADLAMVLPFILLYALAADFLIRRLLGRYPPREGWMTAIAATALASVAFGAAGLLLGQQWSALAESIRIGTAHLGNRALRLPLTRYPTEAFLFAAALFLGIAVVRCSRERNALTAG